jgi:multicomponent Na+:H+ antiporter subunit E
MARHPSRVAYAKEEVRMNGLVFNALLALAWVAISGDVSVGTFAIGFGLGLVIVFFTQRIVGQPTYLIRLWRVPNLLVFFVWELVLANLRVAYDVLTPGYHLRPGVVAVPLEARTDTEITLLANTITLTPGSFSLDVSADRRVLYVHVMYLDEDVDAFRRKIKHGFERRILEVLR